MTIAHTKIMLQDIIADHPDNQSAVIDDDGARFTYDELRSMAADTAQALRDHGVRPGDKVMLVCENCMLYAVSLFAILNCDAWVVPVNARQSSAELAAIAEHGGVRAMVFTPRFSEPAGQHAADYNATTLITLPCGDLLVSPVRDAAPEPLPGDPDERVAALMYTTGTTSAPKGVMLTHTNLAWNATASATFRKLAPDDVLLCVLPVTHIFGFASACLAAFKTGATVRFLTRFSPEVILNELAKGASIFPAVPQMYARILNHLSETGAEFSAPQLRYISSGGAPLDPDWKARTEAVFGLPLNNGYGITEAAPTVAATRPDFPRSDLSVGPAVEGVEIKIHEPDNDGVGEIWIRGPNIMKGYYKNPEANRASMMPEGWYRTGDLGRMAPDGALFIAGRLKELIIRSGFNVHPPEVEAMLTQHPNVVVAAVVGRPILGNEEIVAFIMVEGDIDEPTLKAWLRERLVPYKIPQHIVIVDAFPTAATGKILKHKLLGHFADALAERQPA
ncbi:MAG: AMP-binding protein [Pseudomonadota bacterium]